MRPTLLFDSTDCDVANQAWGCNCGPASLAAALVVTLDSVRPWVEAAGFAEKRYMSPTMMKAALRAANRPFESRDIHGPLKGFTTHGLMRIQWHGPWTQPGMNPKWAYWYTHWIAGWWCSGRVILFDVNGGLMPLDEWEDEIVPAITKAIPRADGRWSITHSWELACDPANAAKGAGG